MTDCVFCGIADGTVPAWRIYEDDHTVAFLDRHPVTRGHVLVVPRRHADDLWTIDEQSAAQVMIATHRVAGLLRTRFQPDGLTLFQANGRAGWQDVFHLHVHVVPRYAGDRLLKPWEAEAASEEELEAVASELA